VVYYQSYEFNTILELEDMGFMVGKSSAKPSLKLFFFCFFWFFLVALVVAWNAAVVSRRENL
jgi:hypothetical protein